MSDPVDARDTAAWPGPHAARLAELLASGDARVGVVGLGYIGLPVTAALVRAGFDVLGVDTNAAHVAELAAGRTPLAHLGAGLAAELQRSGRFEVAGDHERLGSCDAVLLCVPTPLDDQRRPDLSAVERTVAALADVARPGQLVVLESTSWPGTTRELVAARLERDDLRVGQELFVAFAPEREDPVDATRRRARCRAWWAASTRRARAWPACSTSGSSTASCRCRRRRRPRPPSCSRTSTAR